MSQFDRGGGKLLPLNASVPFRGTAFTPQSASPPVTNMYPAALKHLNTILSFLFSWQLRVLTNAHIPFAGAVRRRRPEWKITPCATACPRPSSRAHERTKARPAPEERAAWTAFSRRTAFLTTFTEARSQKHNAPGDLSPTWFTSRLTNTQSRRRTLCVPVFFFFFFKRPTWLIILTRESTKGADGRRFLFMLLLFFLKFPPKCAWSWETRYRPCFCVCALFVNKGNSQMKEKQRAFQGRAARCTADQSEIKAEL